MKNNIRHEIIAWNNRFPLDRWWRKKYDVSYLSDTHRESTFYGQFFEYREEMIFKEFTEEQANENKNPLKDYLPMTGDWWNGKASSDGEIDDWFDTPLE